MRAAIFFLRGCSATLIAGSGVSDFFTMLSCTQMPMSHKEAI